MSKWNELKNLAASINCEVSLGPHGDKIIYADAPEGWRFISTGTTVVCCEFESQDSRRYACGIPWACRQETAAKRLIDDLKRGLERGSDSCPMGETG
jgi:hypothetical protein